jgi:hypothetical protein
MWASLAADDGAAIEKTLIAHAKSSYATNAAGDDRSMDNRMADALRDLVLGRSTTSTQPAPEPATDATTDTATTDTTAGTTADGTVEPNESTAPREPRLHGRRPEVRVTVAWSTLIGLDDAPGWLDGYGPIDAEAARRIAADDCAVWRRLLVDPASGTLLDYGRTTYAPPQDLVDHVIARDRTCRFPTCNRAADTCDLDHRKRWENGGATCDHNLDPLCRRHHRLLDTGWTHHRDPDTGDSTWTDPTGQTWLKPATKLPTPPPVEPPPEPEPKAREDDPPPF